MSDKPILPGRPVRPVRPLSPAQHRVMLAGKRKGGVLRSGAFGTKRPPRGGKDGEKTQDQIDFETYFESGPVIERCIAKGWMAFGKGWGTAVTTPLGIAKLKEYEAFLDAMDAYVRELSEWRQRVKEQKQAVKAGIRLQKTAEANAHAR